MGENGVTFIYVVDTDGNLFWLKDVGRADDRVGWQGPKRVGEGWNDTLNVFPGAGGVVYSIKPNGDLWKFIHRGILDGEPVWDQPDPEKPLATGFDEFKHVFSGIARFDDEINDFSNVIYAIRPDGTLLWFKDRRGARLDGPLDGPRTVGTGWAAPFRVFAGEQNIIYVVEDGKLIARRHLGADTGEFKWTDKVKVSDGVFFPESSRALRWDEYKSIFAGTPMVNFDNLVLQGGFIYLIHEFGHLLRHRHTSFQTGGLGFQGPTVAGNKGIPMRQSWASFTRVFAARL